MAYSLFRDITMRIPPRATSRKRIWNPRKSFPIKRVRRTDEEARWVTLTNDEEHPKWLLRVLDLGKEIGRQTEGQCHLGWLIEVGL